MIYSYKYRSCSDLRENDYTRTYRVYFALEVLCTDMHGAEFSIVFVFCLLHRIKYKCTHHLFPNMMYSYLPDIFNSDLVDWLSYDLPGSLRLEQEPWGLWSPVNMTEKLTLNFPLFGFTVFLFFTIQSRPTCSFTDTSLACNVKWLTLVETLAVSTVRTEHADDL